MVKVIELHPGTVDQKLTWNFLYSDLAWTWWKMIELHPGNADQKVN